MTENTYSTAPEHGDTTRRSFLFLATAATAGMGMAAVGWALVDSMNPSADIRAAGGPVDIELGALAPGQQITVLWQGKPVSVVNRTPEALKTLQDPSLRSRLRDPDSHARQQPPYAANWYRSAKPEYLILVNICTHLGCVPKFRPDANAEDLAPAWPGGFFCPCHGSKYDLAGRVFQGVPAPYNLPVPPYRFVDAKTLRVGENPPGVSFDISQVEQL
ncbi:MAG: ubiquinol-cytochrome c reductase iron-sulfur subunit [Rhodospirillaceae bacterium]|jgi:ubiquinol-cytochrome c reductase iron-sulfur subunit|nr:ubiquinol-cytochrome c reductase iron-sulfur subunit [Rhodospirillaceae bacterium]